MSPGVESKWGAEVVAGGAKHMLKMQTKDAMLCT